MGNKTTSENPFQIDDAFSKNEKKNKNGTLELVSKNSFDYITVIGRGGFGKVWKVMYKKTKTIYAMKEMSKKKIIDKRSEKSIKSERNLLSKIYHPFIVNMHYSFQDKDNLYLVMDILTGGDLRYHLCKRKKFNEEQTKFFVACILLSLEYIHSNNIIHRDLKPENLVLDKKGYIKLTDFGIAKIYSKDKDNSSDTSGTPGYMAPEVLCSLNHTIAVDYFALGVMTYELMMGYRPYLGRSRKEVKEKVMAKQVQVDKYQLPLNWSNESADFVNKLIQRKPNKRLGFNGSEEVKDHPWVRYFNWKDLYLGKIQAPFIPKNGDENFDSDYCNMIEKVSIETKERYEKIMAEPKYLTVFKDYYYYDRNKEMVKAEGKGSSNSKSRNRNSVNSNLTDYVNPHTIYKILEEKEIKAFTFRDEEKNQSRTIFIEHFKKNGHSRNKTANVGLPVPLSAFMKDLNKKKIDDGSPREGKYRIKVKKKNHNRSMI